jgi:putative oxidoreductase
MKMFSHSPIFQDKVLALLRIVIGLLLIFHGKEVFQPELMKSYADWDMFKGSKGLFLVYLGKGSELIAGISFLLGIFTRIGAILCTGTFIYITFFVGHGKFWYEDQHPFMFALFGILYFFTGAGIWSLDAILLGNKSQR